VTALLRARLVEVLKAVAPLLSVVTVLQMSRSRSASRRRVVGVAFMKPLPGTV
jgi:hypothetical protein